MRKTLYGKPSGDGVYIEAFYCGVCHNIPILETKNIATGEVVEAEITNLFPMSITKLTPLGKEDFIIMVCDGCVVKVKDRLKKALKKDLRIDIKRSGSEGDLPSPTPGESPKTPPPL